jgi:hypothetical protein
VGGHLAQDAVTRRVAEAVVDLLEDVDVGQQQREALALGAAGGARRFARPVSGSWLAIWRCWCSAATSRRLRNWIVSISPT